MSEAYLGEIRMFAGNFAPYGWMLCEGQLLSISQYAALFSILGTAYGGNGTSTFGLPNLCARVPVGTGPSVGPNLKQVALGEAVGANQVALQQTNMPPFLGIVPGHSISVSIPTVEANGDSVSPTNANLLATPFDKAGLGGVPQMYSSEASDSTLRPFNVSVPQMTVQGSIASPVSVQNAQLGMTFIIAWQGIYPTRG